MIGTMLCEECNEPMTEVFTAQEDFKLKGWLCTECMEFTPAIGRERKFRLEDKDGHKEGSLR